MLLDKNCKTQLLIGANHNHTLRQKMKATDWKRTSLDAEAVATLYHLYMMPSSPLFFFQQLLAHVSPNPPLSPDPTPHHSLVLRYFKLTTLYKK